MNAESIDGNGVLFFGILILIVSLVSNRIYISHERQRQKSGRRKYTQLKWQPLKNEFNFLAAIAVKAICAGVQHKKLKRIAGRTPKNILDLKKNIIYN